jgi:hypothetical protein
VAFYVLAMVALTLVALWAAPETAWEDLHDHTPDRPHARPSTHQTGMTRRG